MEDQRWRDHRGDLYQRLNSQLTEIQRVRFNAVRVARLVASDDNSDEAIRLASELDQRLSYVAGVDRAYGFDIRSAFLFPSLIAPEWSLKGVRNLKLANKYYMIASFEDRSFRRRGMFENKFITPILEYALIYGGLSICMLDIQSRIRELVFS